MTDSVNRWTRIDSKAIKALKLNTYEGEVILVESSSVGCAPDKVRDAMKIGAENVYFNAQEFFSERELEAMAKATIVDGVITIV